MMALGCSSPNNLQNKLDSLSLDPPPDAQNESAMTNHHSPPTRSLLSKSLAGDSLGQRSPLQSHLHYLDDLEENATDGHPEPSILATSVGKDHGGRLIPSSSNISLLSLSNNLNSAPHLTTENLPGLKGGTSGLAHVNPERVSSYTNLRSRNSITHLGQQRLQPYHKISSPIAPPMGEFNAISSPKTIPWGKNQMIAPDSPNLHPTSIGESPSRFWLNAQTPPKALANLLSRSRNQFTNPVGLGTMPLQANEKHVRPLAINIARGSDSPVLNPVQTPLEDMPMTPLYLSSDGGYFLSSNAQKSFGERKMDYFFGMSEPLPIQEEKEQFQCDSEDEGMT